MIICPTNRGAPYATYPPHRRSIYTSFQEAVRPPAVQGLLTHRPLPTNFPTQRRATYTTYPSHTFRSIQSFLVRLPAHMGAVRAHCARASTHRALPLPTAPYREGPHTQLTRRTQNRSIHHFLWAFHRGGPHTQLIRHCTLPCGTPSCAPSGTPSRSSTPLCTHGSTRDSYWPRSRSCRRSGGGQTAPGHPPSPSRAET